MIRYKIAKLGTKASPPDITDHQPELSSEIALGLADDLQPLGLQVIGSLRQSYAPEGAASINSSTLKDKAEGNGRLASKKSRSHQSYFHSLQHLGLSPP